MFEATDDERQAQDEQDIGEDRPDERRMDAADETTTDGEDPEEEPGEVAKP